MKFQKALDIWELTPEQAKTLQPGQWVTAGTVAGDKSNMGRFLGVKRSGSVVVAWLGNERSQGNTSKRRLYIRALRNYALAH